MGVEPGEGEAGEEGRGQGSRRSRLADGKGVLGAASATREITVKRRPVKVVKSDPTPGGTTTTYVDSSEQAASSSSTSSNYINPGSIQGRTLRALR